MASPGSRRPRTVGILGGMGPEATVDLMRRIIAGTPARDDGDHIPMLVDNNPQVPSRVRALIDGDGESPAPTLKAMAHRLESQGADFLAMPCNTAHHYHREIAASLAIPFLNMVELAAARLAALKPAPRRVGLLASSALGRIGLYDAPLGRYGIEVIYPGPETQDELMALIRRIKSEGTVADASEILAATAADLEASGAQVLLIACTELSVVADGLPGELPGYDTAQFLAEAIIVRALQGGRA